MSEFTQALFNPDIPFLRYAFIVGFLSSIAFGIIGSYVVARRISYIAGAISHSVLGGIGAALFVQNAWNVPWCHPLWGAIAAALLSALIIGFVSLYAHQREDTVIGALWATGMAIGLMFLAKTPGYIDPMSYLFGNILLISIQDVWLIVILDALVIFIGVLFYNKLLAICFDEEFALLRGIKVEFYYLLLLCLTSLTIVLLVRIVGIVMVIALLTLPAAVSAEFSRKLWQMMVLSILFCSLFNSLGLGISYVYDLPSGPTIIILAAFTYLITIVFKRVKSRSGGRKPSEIQSIRIDSKRSQL